MACKTSFVLDNSKSSDILKKRYYIQPLLLITQRKKGTKWNADNILVSFNSKKYNGKDCYCFIAEEEEEKENHGVSISKSQLIYFEHEILNKQVNNGQVTFDLERIFKEKSKQVTKPHFLLCFVIDNAVVGLSEKFHARSRWGVEKNDSQEIFNRLKAMGRNPQNLDLIQKIDGVKELWRGRKDCQHKLEKTCWLQARLIEDDRQGLSLVDRSTTYHKTTSYDKTLEIIQEVDQLILKIAPVTKSQKSQKSQTSQTTTRKRKTREEDQEESKKIKARKVKPKVPKVERIEIEDEEQPKEEFVLPPNEHSSLFPPSPTVNDHFWISDPQEIPLHQSSNSDRVQSQIGGDFAFVFDESELSSIIKTIEEDPSNFTVLDTQPKSLKVSGEFDINNFDISTFLENNN